jgi:hypothetical protein
MRSLQASEPGISYRVKSADNTRQKHSRELPLGNMMIDFGQERRDPN